MTTTKTNPAVEVQKYGQSIWYDNISREMFASGKLQDLIAEYGVLGMTSNPTIFEKAVAESNLYDSAIKPLVNLDASTIFDQLAVEDIRTAADMLRPIYDRTQALDGYVSLEVSPLLANDTETTLSEAKRLFKLVDRPNVMIKIPGTPAGLPAVEEALFAGININITLLFSVVNYVAVAERYIAALERRHAAGLPIDRLASVASFFVSRIDTAIDKQLEANVAADSAHADASRQLLGKVAIANAKVAYKRFKELFHGERFAKLAAAGARPQRPLWASTGTKNPAYPDTLYMNTLIGPDTVNTVPHSTLVAFHDHGVAAPTLDVGLDEAEHLLNSLSAVGIDMEKVTQQLQDDGVTSFIDSFRKLIDRVEGKRKLLST